MSIGYNHPLSGLDVPETREDQSRREAREKARREANASAASREILETLALAHASVGGECLLLALSGQGSDWLPSQPPVGLLTEKQAAANAAALWVVENLPHPYWTPEEQFEKVARVYTGDTWGMSGGKRGIKEQIRADLRQYEQGATDESFWQGEDDSTGDDRFAGLSS